MLVFDLDGTLSDPLEGIWRSVNHALERHGVEPISRDSFGPFIGPPIDVTLRHLVPDADEAAVMSLVDAFRDRYGRIGYAENELYPDVPAMLEGLRGAGFSCGVCTAKRVDIARRVLEHFGLAHYFEFVDGGGVGVRKTQQLRGLLEAGRIDTTALMIGDRASDLQAATANGLRGVAVAWGYGPSAELREAAPWATVESPADLQALLAGHPSPSG